MFLLETALGVRLDERLDGDEYRQNISKIEEILLERLKNPLMMFDSIYYNIGSGRHFLKSMDKLHAFSSGIIEKRRELLSHELNTTEAQTNGEIEEDKK